MGLFDIINRLGGLYLSDLPSLNTGHIVNLFLPDSATVSIFSSFFTYFLNNSRKVPIKNNGTYLPNNYTLNANPNYFISIFSIIWLLSFFIILLVLIMVTIYQCCHQMRMEKYFKRGIIKIKSKGKSKPVIITKFWKKALIVFVVLSTMLWVIVLCLFCIGQSVIQPKLTQSNDSPNNSFASLNTALNYSFLQLNNFYNVMTVDSTKFLQSSVSTMSSSITNLIQSSIMQFVNSMLMQYQIKNVFNDADQLINSLDIDTKSMGFIKDNYKLIFSQINQISGKIVVHQQDIQDNLQNLCVQLSGDLKNTCMDLRATNANFSTLINTTQINTESSVIMLFILEQLQINTTSIILSYKNMNSSFNSNLNKSLISISNQINVSDYFNSINEIWKNTFIPTFKPFFEKSADYNKTSSSILQQITQYENIIIIILIIVIFITIFLILFSFYKESLSNRKCGMCCNFSIQIFVILFSFISAVIAIAFLLSSLYINAEVCRQFNTTEGIKLSDEMLNVKLKEPWKNFVSTLIINGTNIALKLNQPVDIISGINTRCRNKNIGLFEVVGIRDLINVAEIIKSTGISAKLAETQSSTSKHFLFINPNDIISTETETFLNKMKANISLFDKNDYSLSIQQLSKPLLGIQDFPAFFNNLNTFVQNSFKQLGNINDLILLNKTSYQLLENINNFNQTQISMWNMLSQYINLQIHRNNSLFLNQLLSDISSMREFLKNKTNLEIIYNTAFTSQIIGTMLSTIHNIIDTKLTLMTSQLLPCDSVSLIMEAATTTVCTKNNITDGLATLGLLLMMVTVMCQIISLLVMIFTICRTKHFENVSHI